MFEGIFQKLRSVKGVANTHPPVDGYSDTRHACSGYFMNPTPAKQDGFMECHTMPVTGVPSRP